MTRMLYHLAAVLLCLGAIIARGQSPQPGAGDELGTLHYQKANMHLCPEGKWALGEDKWGKIVRVNMRKIIAADWAQVSGVKKAWPMKGFEGVPGIAFHPILSEVKDVDGDGKIEVVYDHAGCDAARGPIYVVGPLTGKIKAKFDYRQQGVRYAQNIALGNFDKIDNGLEIAFCEKGNGDIGNSDVHRADLVRFGLGVEKLPRASMCYGGRVGYADSAETPNTQVAVHDFGDVTFVQEVRGLATGKFQRPGGAIFTGSEGYIGMVAGSSAFFDPKGKLVEKLSGPGDDHFSNFIEAVHSRDRNHFNADIFGGHLSAGLCHLGNISYRLGKQAAPKEILEQLASHKLLDDSKDTFERTRKHLADHRVDIEKTRLTVGPWLQFDPDKEQFVGNAAAVQAIGTKTARCSSPAGSG